MKADPTPSERQRKTTHRKPAPGRTDDGSATTSSGDGPGESMLADAADAREQSIREAAYAYYEARGRADGFALDDWLKAEAQFSTSH